MNPAAELKNKPNVPVPSSAPPTGARKRALGVVAAVVILAGIAWGAYDWLVLRKVETTDNAYVQGHVVQVTPLIAGTVQSVLADDTDFVKAGQTLVQLDASDAKVALEAAKAQLALAVRLSQTEGTSLPNHPQILAASAKVSEAYLNLRRTQLQAPVDGYVARRTVQLGQRVAPGAPLMAVIPLKDVWVEANFKEVQLRHIRIGQPVKLTADLYGSKVEYQGRVAGVAAGTGAAFALLPAQNATGNWIKVVQRVPVRVALDRAQVAAHPLRVGLSMVASVDVQDQSGSSLANEASLPSPVSPAVDDVESLAEQTVRGVIAANQGRPVSAKPVR